MKELTVLATLDALTEVQSFVESELELAGVAMKTMLQVSICVEEIYVNISNYAYQPDIGEATICCSIGGDPMQVIIQFLDAGKPFDPLAEEDADITLSAEERDIGGLGILMVKKSMDLVTYSYENGKNILTLLKNIG